MPEFNGIGLLIVGLCCFVVVLVFAGHFAHKAWRLTKRGIRISRVAAPLAAGLARRSEELIKLGYDVGLKVDEVAINLDRLDRSMRRLQVLLQAFNDSLRPYRRVRDYLGL